MFSFDRSLDIEQSRTNNTYMLDVRRDTKTTADDANGMSACVMESNCDLNGIAVRLEDQPDVRYFGSVIYAQSMYCQ